MTCQQILEAFSDYEDGLLRSGDKVAFEAHLAECAACSRYGEVLRKGRSLLALLPPVEVGEDFSPRLEHRIQHLEDGEILVRERESSSPTSAVTVLAIAVVLALAAWSPTMRRPMEVELPAIVVNEPPLRPYGLIYQTSPLRSGNPDPYNRTIWTGAREFLYQTSHLNERYRQGVVRAGLE